MSNNRHVKKQILKGETYPKENLLILLTDLINIGNICPYVETPRIYSLDKITSSRLYQILQSHRYVVRSILQFQNSIQNFRKLSDS